MSLDNISEEEWKIAAKQHNMTVEELKQAVEEHASQEESHSCGCGSNEGKNHQHHHQIRAFEDFTEDELIEGAEYNKMELEEFKIALVEYLANQNNGCGCGGHDDDHECCGGHNHDDGECCSNH